MSDPLREQEASALAREERMLNLRQAALLVLSLFLFVLALQLMQRGARSLQPFIENTLDVEGPASALGFGWLFAYIVLSGSPVAAVSLTFLDVGLLDATSSYMMLAGSRLGASFIVLFVGLLYALRGHERMASLSSGVLSLMVTITTYLPALPIGLWLLDTRLFNFTTTVIKGEAWSLLDAIYGPLVGFLTTLLPEWLQFLGGLGLISLSFNLFDRALPTHLLKDSAFEDFDRLLYRPVVTFALGLLVTSLTMSVSVSLGLLVPLSVRGYVRRENLLPYIMGANITTFVDTLAVGLLLRNGEAAAVVLSQMFAILLVSLVVLLFAYPEFQRAVLRAAEWLSTRIRRVLIFVFVIVLIPLLLLLVR